MPNSTQLTWWIVLNQPNPYKHRTKDQVKKYKQNNKGIDVRDGHHVGLWFGLWFGCHIPRCAYQPPRVWIWLIANVLMQRKHEGDANDFALRCLSTDLAVAMVVTMGAHAHRAKHSHIHTQNSKSHEAPIRDKPEPKFILGWVSTEVLWKRSKKQFCLPWPWNVTCC